MLVIHARLIVLMAIETGKNRIVGSVAVTFSTTVPFTLCFPE